MRPLRLTVFTAVVGDQTDQVRPPVVIAPGVRYLCFSDRPCDVPPYEWVALPESISPRLDSRRIKILADHPALIHGTKATLWHDASYQLQDRLEWVKDGLRRADMLALRHPSRASIEDEAVRIVRYGYLTSADALAHLARYRESGFLHMGVTCGGLLARRVSNKVAAFNKTWWDEAQGWGGRDQASLGYSAWRHGLRLHHLDGTIRENPYARWRQVAVPA